MSIQNCRIGPTAPDQVLPVLEAPTEHDLVLSNADTLLPMKHIPVKGNNVTATGVVFWDKGSTIVLIRKASAELLKLPGRPCSQYIQVAGHGYEKWETVAYHLYLVGRSGELYKLLPYSVDKITSDIERIRLDGIEFIPVTLFATTPTISLAS